jgi:hypothetical protein
MSFLTNITRSEGDPQVIKSGPSSFSASDRLARNLGWFSIGLGITQIFAAEKITRLLGMQGKESLVRAFGAREIGSGVMTLSVEKEMGLASRIAGDVLDLAVLASAMHPGNRKRENVGVALAMVAGITLLDVIAASATTVRHTRGRGEPRSYGDRSGFPGGIATARREGRKEIADQRSETDASGAAVKSSGQSSGSGY